MYRPHNFKSRRYRTVGGKYTYVKTIPVRMVLAGCIVWSVVGILGYSLGRFEISPRVYKVYAVEPSITVPEGVVKNSEVASTSAGQTPPASTPSASLSDKEEVMDYILEVFGKDADRAIWMAKCESGLRKDAYNGSNKNGTADYGVFQINSVHQKRFGQGYMVDWKENIRVAKKIYDESRAEGL